MRRPLAIAGFSLLIANLLCLLFNTKAAFVMGAAALVCIFLLLLCKNNSRLAQSVSGCCFFFLLGILSFLLIFHINLKPVASLHNTTGYTEFTVVEEKGSYHTANYYVVSVKGLYPNPKKECKIRISLENSHTLSVGNVAGAILTFSAEPTYNLMADGVYLTAVVSQETEPVILGQETSLSSCAHTARQRISQRLIQQGSANTYALVKGICLGDAKELSLDVQSDFYSCGLGHLVAVSGLHTGQIAGLFIGLFLLLTKRKRWVKLCSLVFVWAFVFLTGMSFSALRSAIMFTFFAVGSCFLRKPDSLNTLGGAVTTILLCNPLAVGNIGFLASVSACAGLVLLATPLEAKVRNLFPSNIRQSGVCLGCSGALSATFSATAATIPCNFLSFRSLSLIAPVANVICVPLATGILVFGLSGSVISMIPPLSAVGSLCLWIAHGLASFIIAVVGVLSKIPYHSVTQGTPLALVGFLLFAAGTVFIVFCNKKGFKYWKPLLIFVLCLGMVLSCLLPAFPENTVDFCFLANSYDGGLLAIHGRTAIFIGASMTYELDQLLSSRGLTQIDLWVVPNRDHYTTALTTLAKQFTVKQIMTYQSAKAKGLFSPWDSIPPISCNTTQAFGNILVTAKEDFKSFTLSVGETTLYYADTKWKETHSYPLAFVNQKANAICHTVTCNGTTQNIDTTTVIRVKNDSVKVYQPKFLF